VGLCFFEMVNIVRQNSETKTQTYYSHLEGERRWEIEYNSYSYPCELDKERGAVDSSMVIREIFPDKDGFNSGAIKSFQDVIYLTEDGIGIKFGGKFGYSPVFDGFARLENKIRDDIVESLSSEARELLERGISYYDNLRKKKYGR